MPSLFLTTLSLTSTVTTYLSLITGSTLHAPRTLTHGFCVYLPEILFRCALRYVLVDISFGLHTTYSKKARALESRRDLCVALCFVAVAYTLSRNDASHPFAFNGYVFVSCYATARKLLALLVGLFVLAASREYVRDHTRHLLEYALVRTLAIFFRLLRIRSSNQISGFRALIGFSLNIYVLIFFDVRSHTTREAGVKYYVLSTFSSGLRIYGAFLLYAVINTSNFRRMDLLLAHGPVIEGAGYSRLVLALRLTLTGIFFKLSAFPGHLWAAEVYEGSPDTITVFFRLPVKVARRAFLIHFLFVGVDAASRLWQPYRAFCSAASILWGCFGAISEKNTKRFLAYTSINQIGFLLLGPATALRGGYRSTIIYLAIYCLRNVGFLTVFLKAKNRHYKTLRYLTDFRGFGQQNWLISWSVARSLFSRAGIPPLAGFFGKYYLLLHLQEQELYLLTVVALCASLISCYYYLRFVKTLWFEDHGVISLVHCQLRVLDQNVLFGAEGLLFAFIIFSGAVLGWTDVITLSLLDSEGVRAVTWWEWIKKVLSSPTPRADPLGDYVRDQKWLAGQDARDRAAALAREAQEIKKAREAWEASELLRLAEEARRAACPVKLWSIWEWAGYGLCSVVALVVIFILCFCLYAFVTVRFSKER